MPSDFKKLITSRFFFVLAVQIQAIILGWQMYVLTGSAFYLGMIGLVEAAPALGLALYAGYLVDHHRPLPIYRGVLLVSFISGAILLIAQNSHIGLSRETQVVALFISSFLTGVSRAFVQPSIFAIVPKIVPRHLLSKATAITASTMQVARISGPAAGGILFGWLGVSPTAALICLLLMCSMTASFFLKLSHTPDIPNQGIEADSSFSDKLFSGVRYVFRHPVLFPALTLDMVSVLLGGVTALLPIYAAEILHVGPQGLGMLRAAPAVGATLMSIRLAFFPLQKRAGVTLLLAVAGFGFAILIFAMSEHYLLSMAALSLSGAFDSISMVVRSTAVQLSSPDNMRGRISAVNSIFIGSSNELGEFESGVLASLIGPVPAAVVGGIACILTVIALSLKFPQLRRLDLAELAASERHHL